MWHPVSSRRNLNLNPQWRIRTFSLRGGPVLFYLPSRLFFIQSVLLLSPKIGGWGASLLGPSLESTNAVCKVTQWKSFPKKTAQQQQSIYHTPTYDFYVTKTELRLHKFIQMPEMEKACREYQNGQF